SVNPPTRRASDGSGCWRGQSPRLKRPCKMQKAWEASRLSPRLRVGLVWGDWRTHVREEKHPSRPVHAGRTPGAAGPDWLLGDHISDGVWLPKDHTVTSSGSNLIDLNV